VKKHDSWVGAASQPTRQGTKKPKKIHVAQWQNVMRHKQTNEMFRKKKRINGWKYRAPHTSPTHGWDFPSLIRGGRAYEPTMAAEHFIYVGQNGYNGPFSSAVL
jgi:hypothetical protein